MLPQPCLITTTGTSCTPKRVFFNHSLRLAIQLSKTARPPSSIVAKAIPIRLGSEYATWPIATTPALPREILSLTLASFGNDEAVSHKASGQAQVFGASHKARFGLYVDEFSLGHN